MGHADPAPDRLRRLTVVLGFAGHTIAEVLGEHGEALDLTTALISTAVAVAGIGLGWWVVSRGRCVRSGHGDPMGRPMDDRFRAPTASTGSSRASSSSLRFGCVRWMYRVVDRRGHRRYRRGAVRPGAHASARSLAALQNGEAQWYAALIGAGAVALAALILSMGG